MVTSCDGCEHENSDYDRSLCRFCRRNFSDGNRTSDHYEPKHLPVEVRLDRIEEMLAEVLEKLNNMEEDNG